MVLLQQTLISSEQIYGPSPTNSSIWLLAVVVVGVKVCQIEWATSAYYSQGTFNVNHVSLECNMTRLTCQQDDKTDWSIS